MVSVQRFHRGIGASKSGKCTHAARRVRVDVAVGERHLSVVDEHTSSLPTKEGARFRSVPGKGIHRGIGTRWRSMHRDTYMLRAEQSKTVTRRETSSEVSSTIPSGRWKGRSRSTDARYLPTAQARVEARDDVSSTIPSGHWSFQMGQVHSRRPPC